MIKLNGEIIAELNDKNTVKTTNTLDGRLMIGHYDKSVSPLSEVNSLVYLGEYDIYLELRDIKFVKLVPNSYLCTDRSGNLIFKEL